MFKSATTTHTVSSKSKKPAFYAVRNGRIPGIYPTWEECEKQVKAFQGAIFKKFPSASEAEDFVNGKVSPPKTSVEAKPAKLSTTTASGKDKKPKQNSVIEDESGWDVIYTDGACKGNGKAGSIAGIGVWWGVDDSRNIAERCPGDQTNNRAELIAIIRALEKAPISHRPLLIKTDSKYSINCFELWIHNWKKNNFHTTTGHPVKNKDVILYLSELLQLRAFSGQKVRLQYVKGHCGIEGNEGADMLANRGALRPEEEDREWVKLLQDMKRNIKELSDKTSKEKDLVEIVGPDGKVVPLSIEEPSTAPSEAVASSPSDIIISRPRKRKLNSPGSTSPPRQRVKGLDDDELPPVAKHASLSYTPLSSRYPARSSKYQSSLPLSPKSTTSSTAIGAIGQTAGEKSAAASISMPTSSPHNHAYTSMAISANEINFEDYANDILSDEDLAKEVDF